jgi:hypothetical protein
MIVMLAAVFPTLSAAEEGKYVDITRPGDPVVMVNGVNDGDIEAREPPPWEDATHAIDDFGQFYRNYFDLRSGFAVTPTANPEKRPLAGLRFYTAHDQLMRDPASYELFGSNESSMGPWTQIAFGQLELPDGRNPLES